MSAVRGTRLTVCPEAMADEDRMSHLCAAGQHERCSGLILQAGNKRNDFEPVERLCDCPEPSCTCQNRARALRSHPIGLVVHSGRHGL